MNTSGRRRRGGAQHGAVHTWPGSLRRGDAVDCPGSRHGRGLRLHCRAAAPCTGPARSARCSWQSARLPQARALLRAAARCCPSHEVGLRSDVAAARIAWCPSSALELSCLSAVYVALACRRPLAATHCAISTAILVYAAAATAGVGTCCALTLASLPGVHAAQRQHSSELRPLRGPVPPSAARY